jgi:hypothetical protein
MENIKCNICGGNVDIDEKLMISTCRHCGTQQPLSDEMKERIRYKQKEIKEQAEEKSQAEEMSRLKKIVFISVPIIIICILIISLSIKIYYAECQYNKAINLVNDKNYLTAADIFIDLEGYKDSKTKMRECKYLQAIEYLNAKQYRDAVLLLYELGDYKDSKEILEQYKFFDLKIGDIVKFGSYEQDNNISNGAGVIAWRVLAVEDGKALLLSDMLLDYMDYSDNQTDVTWEISYIRKWLDNDFINSAFSSEEQNRIISVKLKTEDNEKYRTIGGNDTIDKIFL